MKPQPKLKDERKLMRDLMRKREKSTPQHNSPDWIARFWKGLAS